MKNKKQETNRKRLNNHLRIHYEIIFLLYTVTSFISFKILSLSNAHKDLATLLSTGAILATFGSAIGSIGLIWQSDLFERVRLNVDILFKDIMKQDSPWRRWPFLPRFGKQRLLDGKLLQTKLSNPQIPLDVGTHLIEIDIPTVLEDFFDLPLLRNYWQLVRFRNSAHTVYARRPKDEENSDTGLKPLDEYMAYECIYDIWKAIFKFRITRYIIHFGSGLTISGALTTAICVWI